MKKTIVFLALLLSFNLLSQTTPTPKSKVLLEGFWWRYQNSDYDHRWADYLSDLAPRLGKMGISMVWVPPASKNWEFDGKATGYQVFDHYDLGDKYQKESLRTAFGTKDEYLRMVAVLHANGMEVVQDVVFNHITGAGSANGAGGQALDFDDYCMSSNGGYKVFRYSCFKTPALDESASDYISREGRWSKNCANFRRNKYCTYIYGDLLYGASFGPDFAYENVNSFGKLDMLSDDDSAIPPGRSRHDPDQYPNYNLEEASKWLIWMKKQTGVDGLRWDAVELFHTFVTTRLCQDIRDNAGWASGGQEMFNVGELASENADNWVMSVNPPNTDMMGAFDFNLRHKLRILAETPNLEDLGSFVDFQMKNKSRTVPFVNNHDTFRPARDINGNYTGSWTPEVPDWKAIRPSHPRFTLSYVLIFALDGTPQVFFEDLFNIGSTNMGYHHDPKDEHELPVRPEIVNLIWCHQKLDFKAGELKARWKQKEVLVIERSKRAIIGLNVNGNTLVEVEITTDFPAGTQLEDYTLGLVKPNDKKDLIVGANGKLKIKIPPCSVQNRVRTDLTNSCDPITEGYVIIGPENIRGSFDPIAKETKQEWEMANDLGDSHVESLNQGGALPANSTASRNVGNIYSAANQNVEISITPDNKDQNINVSVYNQNGSAMARNVSALVAEKTEKGDFSFTFSAPINGYYNININNADENSPSQVVRVSAKYIAPKVLQKSQPINELSNYSLRKTKTLDSSHADFKVKAYPNPFSGNVSFSFSLNEDSGVKIYIYNAEGKKIKLLVDKKCSKGANIIEVEENDFDLKSGFYMYEVLAGAKSFHGKLIKN